MKNKRIAQSAFFRLSILLGLIVFFAGALLVMFAAGGPQALTRDGARHLGELHRANTPSVAPAGGVYEAWVARYNGPGNNHDEARAIAVDSSGNVYVAGTSYGSGTLSDYATIKYNSTGQQQWVARYNGPENGDEELHAMAVDSAGNVYVTGWSGINNSHYDCTTVKYNSAGQEEWVARYNAAPGGFAVGEGIAVDGSGNVYVAAGTPFCATIKYNAAGQEQWVAEYHGGANHDFPAAIAVGQTGNVYVSGASSSCPFDDYLTVEYNSAGQEQWVARYNGPGNNDDKANANAVDTSGNVCVTGESFAYGSSSDYVTIKYDAAGHQQWLARYDHAGGSDRSHALALDNSGNVYVTGEVGDQNAYADYGTVKYNAAGQQQWVAFYNGPPGNAPDVATSVAIDGSGNVYVTGSSSRINYCYCESSYATIKYNSAGQEQWATRYDGTGDDDNEAVAIAVDQLGNVYVTGIGGNDFVTVKYGQGASPTPTVTPTASPTPTPTLTPTPSTTPNPTITPTPPECSPWPCNTPSPTPTGTPTPVPLCCQYVTGIGAGAIVPGTLDIGNHCDNCLTLVSFPFTVHFYDATFNQAFVNSNGSLLFTGNEAYLATSCPLPDFCLDAAILAYQSDLRTDRPGDGVFTSISGTAPNRVFNIEWRTSYLERMGTANFEVRLYENRNSFDIVYGATVDNGALEESGIQQGSIGQCDAPATTFSCHTPILTNGLKVTYAFGPCITPRSKPTPRPRPTPPPRSSL
jgi:uncharacterized delta-60 repeat protein